MKYLVDANVLSEPTRRAPDASVLAWIHQHERQIVTSAVVVGELEHGILLLPAGRKRRELERWFRLGVGKLRILDFTARTAHAWAELLARLKKKGAAMPIKDSLIAASALEHDLSIATRNISDFRHAQVQLVNPWEHPGLNVSLEEK